MQMSMHISSRYCISLSPTHRTRYLPLSPLQWARWGSSPPSSLTPTRRQSTEFSKVRAELQHTQLCQTDVCQCSPGLLLQWDREQLESTNSPLLPHPLTPLTPSTHPSCPTLSPYLPHPLTPLTPPTHPSCPTLSPYLSHPLTPLPHPLTPLAPPPVQSTSVSRSVCVWSASLSVTRR